MFQYKVFIFIICSVIVGTQASYAKIEQITLKQIFELRKLLIPPFFPLLTQIPFPVFFYVNITKEFLEKLYFIPKP